MAIDSLEACSLKLSRLATQISKVEEDIANPPPGAELACLAEGLKELQEKYLELDAEIDFMEAEAPPPSVMDDMFAHQDTYIPLDEPTLPAWTEDNYRQYEECTAPLFTHPSSKIPLDQLFIEMEESANSKILLPCPLELYTEDEINLACPRGHALWFNRYDNPMEPVKCWSREVFKKVYEKPSFHFMFA